jgi:lipoic acid synthetase
VASELLEIGRGTAAFTHRRLPAHCLRPPRRDPVARELERLLRRHDLHTVCEEARCPNRPVCWSQRAVTFMLLGDVCTRACGFCSVRTGRPPAAPDPEEPGRVALAARPETTVEVLTPDFQGSLDAVGIVCDAAPDVFGHNVETVPRLYRRVRPGARFERSLAVLAEAKRRGPAGVVKSGLMVGFGEAREEVIEVARRLREAGVDALTVGQYLRPTRHHLPVERYWEPAEFDALAAEVRALGFASVASGPLVRSSFGADEAYRSLRTVARSARGQTS